jgi:DNA-binding IclR family transcriptional regulator
VRSNAVQNAEPGADGAEDRYLVASVSSASRLLAALAGRPRGGATLTELANELGLAKSTAHGLLFTLCREGLVRRDERTRRFGLGAALVGLGHSASMTLHGAALASERASQLAREHALTVGVAQITDAGDAQIVERAYPPDTIYVGVPIGSRYGPFDGAIGKCLLALLPDETARQHLENHPLPRHTPQSIVSADAMASELEQVRSRGWASSMRELRDHNAVAAPLLTGLGPAELILFAVGFPSQLGDADVERVGGSLRDAAAAIARECGYQQAEEGR